MSRPRNSFCNHLPFFSAGFPLLSLSHGAEILLQAYKYGVIKGRGINKAKIQLAGIEQAIHPLIASSLLMFNTKG
jgi:hypothetical protein